ncbi:glycosyltransferase [Microbacterium terrisoli]|uniref:glycosyltransferase n=1 Tax=Microbacterium terrisoli TaxID=3242192 RepID=UPI002804C7F0|nr:glycosyltransferase [Microbacterium protaetiae]
MRVALAKNTLAVPPTYFAVQHALALQGVHDFRFFAAAAEITDAAITSQLDVFDASRFFGLTAGLGWARRERIAPLLGGRVASAIRRWRPDVVHQHFANLSGAAVAAAERLAVPLILTVHGADVYLPLTDAHGRPGVAGTILRRHQRIVARAFDHADRILAVSRYLAGKAMEAGADASKVAVHYQGVDTEIYRPEAQARSDRVPRIVAVSALKEAKGTRDLIEASIALSALRPHELVLVGDGPLRAVAEAAADEHPHIRVRGGLDREGVRRELAAATVFALPTKKDGAWREAAGLVTLEAQACGVPVVVYDSGGAGEMLDDGTTGVLVPEGDIGALSDVLGQFLALAPAERAAVGARARDWVVANRSLAGSAHELDAHYQEVIG